LPSIGCFPAFIGSVMEEIRGSRTYSTLEVVSQPATPTPIKTAPEPYYPGPYSQGPHLRVSSPLPEAYYGESMIRAGRAVGPPPDQNKLTRRPWFWITLGLVVLVAIGGIVGGVVGGLRKNRHSTSSPAEYDLIPAHLCMTLGPPRSSPLSVFTTRKC
jgi:hypothetical protein